jgi:hypothetical protein
MNIFILDTDVLKCAQYHCDQHVIKMILECAQMLCTTLNKRGMQTPYRSTHVNHPCVLWLDESYDNFLWLRELALALNREYRYRYGRERDHASIRVIREIEPLRHPARGLTPFAQAMPDLYKVPGDAVRAYRRFYSGEKLGFATWTRRPVPGWIKSVDFNNCINPERT